MKSLILLISSGLYTGYIPFASGTFATALAILLFWPLAGLNHGPLTESGIWIYLLVVAVVSVIGTWASNFAEKHHGEKDPHKVVIDEIAGFGVTMILVPYTWPWLIAAFFLFRLFDVWKPYPIRGLQRLPGGYGIMIDDLIAGAYSCVLLHAAMFFIV